MKMINFKRIFLLLNLTIFLFSSISLARKQSKNKQYSLDNKRSIIPKNYNHIDFIEKNNQNFSSEKKGKKELSKFGSSNKESVKTENDQPKGRMIVFDWDYFINDLNIYNK